MGTPDVQPGGRTGDTGGTWDQHLVWKSHTFGATCEQKIARGPYRVSGESHDLRTRVLGAALV